MAAKGFRQPPTRDLKGGGDRGGPRRWTGKGPAPARHIPWPEIFKHHISVVDGHMKMIDMIRKFTEEGTANHRTITEMLDRCHEMMRQTKQTSRDFVPPPNQKEQVPLGVTSDSMYPGYSPADHIYGEAAQEYGKYAKEAKAQGKESLSGLTYELGQGKGDRGKTLAEMQDRESEARNKHGDSEDFGGSSKAVQEKATNDGSAKDDANPYFVIDTNPTPMPGVAKFAEASKRENDGSSFTVVKRAKMENGAELRAEVEMVDITEAADASLRAKEEKRKAKKEKKRKRESNSQNASGEDVSAQPAKALEKPRKKKAKNAKEEVEEEVKTEKKKKRQVDEEGDKRKKRKKRSSKGKD